ncbi:helix-turn-helix domain-containing protein [Microvirga yunnanensis]|uniref:helix-turn-helix domain-containing protein n=1 Tax=Microvirga yunnanensis TaxID=2953740 RepID=UPI0021C9FA95|nr:winged helix-turn-helix domain-containing protein [Microvirga sp. HBU65207]
MAAGFATERWTLARIAALIEREFGVHYHPRSLERPLKAHGFSVQRPATRAKERDELVIAVWPKRECQPIRQSATRRSNAMPSSNAPWRTLCPGQSLICTVWPAVNSVACKVNPR